MNRRQAGWSYVELIAATTVFMVGLLGFAGGFLNMSRLTEESQDTDVLKVSCQNVIESLRSVPLNSVITQFGSGSGQDQFWCDHDGNILFSPPSDVAAEGEIEFFNDESTIPDTFADLSDGFDLNGNGIVDFGPVTDFKILPARVTLEVSGPNGPRTVVVDFLLYETQSL